jgi:hypothetical protein
MCIRVTYARDARPHDEWSRGGINVRNVRTMNLRLPPITRQIRELLAGQAHFNQPRAAESFRHHSIYFIRDILDIIYINWRLNGSTARGCKARTGSRRTRRATR